MKCEVITTAKENFALFLMQKIQKRPQFIQEHTMGSGGGASGRAMAFCPYRPGSNLGTDSAFLAQNCCLSILTGRWLSLRTCYRTVHAPSSSSF